MYSQGFICQLSSEQLNAHFPERARPFKDLAYHIFIIIKGFLDAANGGKLSEAHFLITCPEDMNTVQEIADEGEVFRLQLLNWWEEKKFDLPETLNTYYNHHSVFSVLDRTAWHSMRHVRQLQAIVEMKGKIPNGTLRDQEMAEMAGLLCQKNIYDNEIAMDARDVASHPLPDSLKYLVLKKS